MTAGVRAVLEEYLRGAGVEEGPVLGSEGGEEQARRSKQRVDAQEQAREKLLERLSARRRANEWIVVLAVACYVAIFILGVGTAVIVDRGRWAVGGAVGGGFVLLLAVARGMRRLWIEKSMVDTLLTVVPSLSAGEAVRAIESIYYADRKTERAVPGKAKPRSTPQKGP